MFACGTESNLVYVNAEDEAIGRIRAGWLFAGYVGDYSTIFWVNEQVGAT